MNNLSLSIDLLQLQGAERKTAKDGREYVVIELAKSRAKPHANGKVYLNLEVIEAKQPGKFGDTHFCKEATSKQERDEGVQVPIIGNAKPWGKPKPQAGGWDDEPRKVHHRAADAIQEDDGSEIPF